MKSPAPGIRTHDHVTARRVSQSISQNSKPTDSESKRLSLGHVKVDGCQADSCQGELMSHKHQTLEASKTILEEERTQFFLSPRSSFECRAQTFYL